ncbi:F-box/kelch-repeat protein At3g23880-like [Vicia villosa]|uniref:F-box/kelch-repeat protein At3g23880-like n=1 Tax=Vicia villosa TaxID=3911 RepID=UPI00273B8C5A|nr:F-box/kelch-repeat protein At3g23880-like [Vicia villosa]
MKSLPPAFVPDELVTDVLSRLAVKPLMRFRCVRKSWNSLISDPTFVKLILHRSSQYDYFTLVSAIDFSVVSFTLYPFFKNFPISFTLPKDPYYQLNTAVGCCNGLLCMVGSSWLNGNIESWFCIWNPITRTMSERFGSFYDDLTTRFNFTFGCDKSNSTYKVVTVTRTNVRVFSLQDNAWRDFQTPIGAHYFPMTKVVYMNGSVNWLAFHHHFGPTDKPSLIISLDLGTETHTQFRPPRGLDIGSFVTPNLSVLNDCICLSHDFQQTHFLIWKMKEFGVEDSWTQFLKISYNNLKIDYPFSRFNVCLLPLCYSEKNDTLLVKNEEGSILYYRKDNTLEKINGPWLYTCTNYVESLVS